MWIGAITCLFMGLLGLVQNDIKRVIAYSTLSQLGYMTVALGVVRLRRGYLPSRHPRFLQGIALPRRRLGHHRLHHEQDMRKMGGLWKYMPITWVTSVIGTLALVGFPRLLRVLLQGRDHRGHAPFRPAGLRGRLRDGARQRSHHVALFFPADVIWSSTAGSAWTSTPGRAFTRRPRW